MVRGEVEDVSARRGSGLVEVAYGERRGIKESARDVMIAREGNIEMERSRRGMVRSFLCVIMQSDEARGTCGGNVKEWK